MQDDLILELENGGNDLELEVENPADLVLEESNPYITNNYESLQNLPRINNVMLIGNKTSQDLHIQQTDPLTNLEIESMIASVFGN